MIKHRILIAAVVLASALVPAAANAGRISIEIGDRPYYRGGTYWDNDWEMVWVPGHWSHHRHEWIHGHYIRGAHHRHWNRHRDWRDDRRDDRRDERRDDRRYDDDRR
ncbi:MAG TPA: hypothetical protein VN921_04430 [Chthoniobacterales bacterium]|nr:hypothetical protein [Chthoniobacterales bacterium]